MVALGLALGASIAWGGSDFLAGLVARRLPVLNLLLLSQAAGLVLLLVLLALAGQPAPPADAVLIAGGAGLAEMVGFAALYRALAIGPMSVVAPLASLAAVVPVAAGVAGGERPGPAVAAGLALAVACGAPGRVRARSRRAPPAPHRARRGAGRLLGAGLRRLLRRYQRGQRQPGAWRGRSPSTAAPRSRRWPSSSPSGAAG